MEDAVTKRTDSKRTESRPNGSQERIPYRYPQPKESFPELVVPHAIPEDERLWVPQMENVWFRPLCLSASRGYWVNLLRVRKSGVLSRHRHPQPWLCSERELALSGTRLDCHRGILRLRSSGRNAHARGRSRCSGNDHAVPG